MATTLELSKRNFFAPAENREHLTMSLLDSLPDSDDGPKGEFSPELWKEFERRSAELVDGIVVGVPYEIVMKEIDALLSQGCAAFHPLAIK